jgi:membrane protease YdiL (CAAX protease family)
MKTVIKNYPNASSFVLAIILFVIALIFSLFINVGAVKQYFPYTAPLLLFVATWFLYKREGKTLKTIGLNFSLRNLLFLPLGILIGAFAFFGAKYLRTIWVGETFELSVSIDYSTLLYAFYFILPQVATEELLFRGYLFKKTIEVSNMVISNVIFSILFMLIHVLDEGVLSNVGMIIMLGVSIPVGHLLFATGLLKSKTLYFPIGLHLGNNWATRHLISSDNSGESIFFISNSVMFDAWMPFIAMLILFNGFYLLATLIIWKWDKIIIFFDN